MKLGLILLNSLLILLNIVLADERFGSTSGNIHFDVGNNGQSEMILAPGGYLGIQVSEPGNTLDVGGNAQVSGQLSAQNVRIVGRIHNHYQSISSNTILGSEIPIVLVDSENQGDLNLTLPAPSDLNGKQLSIKNIGSGNIYINSGLYYVDQDKNVAIQGHGAIQLISNGSKWIIINRKNASAIASDNLLSWWRLEETSGNVIKDDGPLKNDGLFLGSNTIQSIPGVLGQAIDFDGSDQSIEISNPSLYNTNELTIALWFRVDAFDKQWQCLIGRNDSAWQISRQSNSDSLRALGMQDDANINDARWHHIAAVQSALHNKKLLYIDGTLSSNADGFTNFLSNSSNVSIGTLNTVSHRTWEGAVDDVRIYNKALTQNEIRSIMGMPDIVSDLVAHWTFDETSGNTLQCLGSLASSGNGVLSGHGGNTFSFSGNSTLGVSGNALRFNGSDDRVTVSDTDALDINDAITISLWAKSDTTNWNESGMLLSKRDSYVMNPIVSTKEMKFYIHNGTWVETNHTSSDNLQEWHMYTGTYGSNTLSLYVDGVLQSTVSTAGNISSSGNDLYLGFNDTAGNTNRYFDGELDEVKIYSRSLTADEVKHLYDSYHGTWTPAQIDTALWLDASDTSTISSSGGNVSQWNDKSSNLYHVSQATESNKPQTGTANINGLNVIDWGSTSNSKCLVRDGDDTQNWQDVYVVLRFDGGSSFTEYNGVFTGYRSFGPGGGIGLSGDPISTSVKFYAGWANNYFINGFSISSPATALPTIQNVSLISFSANSAIALDGVSIGTDRNNAAANRGWRGAIAEVLAFNRQLNEDERLKLEGYLAHKWGLTHLLPMTHRYKSIKP